MKNSEILKRLIAITKKMGENNVGAWEFDLEDTTNAIITEDHNLGEDGILKYNGWCEDIDSLINDIKQAKTHQKRYFLFGEDIVRCLDTMTEEDFLTYAKDENNSYGMHVYTEGETSPSELLEAITGWFDYSEISEELYNKIKDTV